MSYGVHYIVFFFCFFRGLEIILRAAQRHHSAISQDYKITSNQYYKPIIIICITFLIISTSRLLLITKMYSIDYQKCVMFIVKVWVSVCCVVFIRLDCNIVLIG